MPRRRKGRDQGISFKDTVQKKTGALPGFSLDTLKPTVQGRSYNTVLRHNISRVWGILRIRERLELRNSGMMIVLILRKMRILRISRLGED